METLEVERAHAIAGNIPGTVQLVDLTGTMKAKHASGLEEQDIILIPAPSKDPEDPLNWTRGRKKLHLACISIYALMMGFPTAVVYSILKPVSIQTGLSVATLNAGTGYSFLLAGWGCLFWQPLALQYGKRPVYLASLLGTVAVMIWTPYATTEGQWLASKILSGFFSAPVESLCEISTTDIFFKHELFTYMAVYSFFLTTSSHLAPTFGGLINTGMGWKWVMDWCAIGSGAAFIFCFFFLEETNYDRKASEIITNRFEEEDGAAKTTEVTGELEASIVYPRKTYWQKLSLRDKKRPNRLFSMATRPLKFFSFPIVVYAGFAYGFNNLVWGGVLSGTASVFFSGAPYNFSTSAIAYVYLGTTLAGFVASIYCGVVGKWLLLKLARRNNGIAEPEHGLWLFILSTIVIPSALLLWGLGFKNQIHWFGMAFALFALSTSSSTAPTIAINYCINSYSELGSETVTTMILIRNTLSFAVNYGITPWRLGMGIQNTFILAACLGFFICLLELLMIKFGPALRKRSSARYWRYVQESRDMGLSH